MCACRGMLRVGAQPSKGQLVRALADMHLVGVGGYRELCSSGFRARAPHPYDTC